jgi:hypothetical protein
MLGWSYSGHNCTWRLASTIGVWASEEDGAKISPTRIHAVNHRGIPASR